MPSSLQWVAQIQKDGYFFAGMLAALLAWLQLLELICGQGGWARLIRAAILLAAGVASVAFSRVYGIQLLQIAGCAIAAVSLIAAARHGLRACPAVALLLIVALPWALSFSPSDNRLQAEPPAANSPTATGRNEAETILLRQWHRSGWLPEFAERTLLRLCIARQGFVMEPYRSAGSTLDADVVFANAGDIIRYLPRAVQIGFLAPFPNQWLEPGKSTGGGIMRRIAALEMTVVYLTILLGLPLAVCLWRKTPWLWLTVGFCSLIVIADAYAIPNVGTLYRLRYGFLMTVAALGLAAILTYSERVSARLVPPANG
jgi:hypothetical protein